MSQEPVKREINQEVLEKLKKDIMFEVKPKKLTFREKLARILNIKVFRFDRQQRKEEVQSFITISNDGIGVYTKNDFVCNQPKNTKPYFWAICPAFLPYFCCLGC